MLSSIGGGRSAAFALVLCRQPGFVATPAGQAWLDEFALVIGSERDIERARELLVRLKTAGMTNNVLMRVVLALARGLERSGGSVRPLLEGDKATIEPLMTRARLLVDSAAPAEERVCAIRLLGLAGTQDLRETFARLLDARQPAAVQLAVLQNAAGVFHSDAPKEIIARWKSMSPSVRREAVEVLLSRRASSEALVAAIEARVVPVSEIDPNRRRRLLQASDPATQARVGKVIALLDAPARDRSRVVASYQPALKLAGDRERGRAVFQKVCATCHKAEGRGNEVAPSLETVATRSPDDLLMHILDPNREVAANFVTYSVATDDGRVLTGIIAEESATALVLKRAEGATDVVPRSRIEQIASTGVSLMPEGLEKDLSVGDLANLIAFIRSIQPQPAATSPR